MNNQMVNMRANIETLGLSANATNACINDWYQPLTNAVYYHYPSWTCWHQPSKIEQAFKIVGKLMEKKLIVLKTVGDFVTTVNEVAELL